MSLEENHKGYLSPFPFSPCQLLKSSEAPNRVTTKVKCSGLPYAYASVEAPFFPNPLVFSLPLMKEWHFIKKVWKSSGALHSKSQDLYGNLILNFNLLN